MMELELELKCTSDELKVPPARSVTRTNSCVQRFAKSSIELNSGCDLYLRSVTRTATGGPSEVPPSFVYCL